MPTLHLKRFFRSFRDNFSRFFGQIILVAAVVTVITSFESTAFTVIDGRSNNSKSEKIEDGQFTTLFPISDEDILRLSEEYDVEIQKNYGLDVTEDEKTYRVFKQRTGMDILSLCSGTLPCSDTQIVIEQNYARDCGIDCGDTFFLGQKEYTVCGMGSLPDYVHVTQHLTDMCTAENRFCWVVVTDNEFDSISEILDCTPDYTYGYRLGKDSDPVSFSDAVYDLPIDFSSFGQKDSAVQGFLVAIQSDPEQDDFSNVLHFSPRDENRRMDFDLKNAYLYRDVGFFVGILLVGMLAFIFAVVIRNQVYLDHSMIGSLYALGIRKHTIISYYVLPDVLLSLLGGALGLFSGYLPQLTDISVRAFHKINSFPYYEASHPVMIRLYALAMPPVVCFIVNYFVLIRALSYPALPLIRGSFHLKKIVKLPVKSRNFVRCFQLRRILEERGSLIIFVSIFSSFVLLMMGLSAGAMIKNNLVETKSYTDYNYLYSIKYPVADFNADGEKLYVKEVKTDLFDENLSFSLIGLPQDSTLLPAHPQPELDCAVASQALASKFNLQPGDRLSFHEGIAGKEYTVRITDIVKSGSNLELYMDIDCVRQLFNSSDSFYNTVVSVNKLSTDDVPVYSESNVDDAIQNITVMKQVLTPFMCLVLTSAVIIFCVTLFLTVSTVIDRVTAGISLLQVLGYTTWETCRMYVSPVIYSVIVALAAAIPAAKWISDRFSLYIYRNFAVGMFFELPMQDYFIIFGAALALFFLILLSLLRKIKKIDTSVALKCRE